jgi:hypothetical protein
MNNFAVEFLDQNEDQIGEAELFVVSGMGLLLRLLSHRMADESLRGCEGLNIRSTDQGDNG